MLEWNGFLFCNFLTTNVKESSSQACAISQDARDQNLDGSGVEHCRFSLGPQKNSRKSKKDSFKR